MAFSFDKSQLLLTDEKSVQLTTALANLDVADPLQQVCDEAAAVVTRMMASYALTDAQVAGFIRAIALFEAYRVANIPAPDDVSTANDAAMKELTAIASGERPNLPKVADSDLTPGAGSWGSNDKTTGRFGT